MQLLSAERGANLCLVNTSLVIRGRVLTSHSCCKISLSEKDKLRSYFKSTCQEAYTLGVSRQLRGRNQDCIWHGRNKHLPKMSGPWTALVRASQAGSGITQGVRHGRSPWMEGSRRIEKQREGVKEVTAWETKPGSVKDRFSGLWSALMSCVALGRPRERGRDEERQEEEEKQRGSRGN